MGASFSPDGSQIVISRTPDPNYYGFDLEIYTTGGTLVRKLTNNGGGPIPVSNRAPNWSSDNRIAFASNSTGRSEIYTINPDGSNLTQVTSNGGTSPSWSPDASKIAFASDRTGNSQVYTIPAPH
jgi:TolB protein